MQIQSRVVDNRLLWANNQAITVNAPGLARTIRPGQFALARDPSTLDPYLRRVLLPLSIQADQIQFALDKSDPLATRAQPQTMLDLLAPIGRAISIDSNARHVLLAIDGANLAPIVFLAQHAIQLGKEVVLVARANGITVQFPPNLLPEEIEYHTRRENEPWLNPEWITWADVIFACGTSAAYREMFDTITQAKFRAPRGLAQVWINAAMPCGIGDCFGCAVDTARGFVLACEDGPFFDLTEIIGKRSR